MTSTRINEPGVDPFRIKALFFDVFGTLVDWRGSIARDARAILSPLGVAVDWFAFADAWRAQYQPAMDDVRSGRLPFCKLDVLHRRNLDVILRDFDLDRIDEPARMLRTMSAVINRGAGLPGICAVVITRSTSLM